MRRCALFSVFSFVLGCGGGSGDSNTTGNKNSTTQEPLKSISFTLGKNSSEGDTDTGLEKLNCTDRAKAFAAALENAWPKSVTHGGLSLAVRTKDCAPYTLAVGHASPDTPLTPEHVMGAGGLSKSLMAATFMLLADEQKIDVYDPVSKYLPELADKKINLRNILNHQKALADYTLDTTLLAQAKAAPDKALSTDDLLKPIQSKDAETSAKLEQFLLGYSNAIALDKIAQGLSKQDTPTLIKAKLLDPMGIKGMHVWGASPSPEKTAPGWMQKDNKAIRRDELVPNSYLGAAAGLRSTPAALAHWLEGLITSKSALPPTSLAYMMRRTAFESTAAEQMGYGLKIWALKPGIDAYGNDGMSPGYVTLAITVPTQQVTIVLMSNNESQKPALLSAFKEVFSIALRPWTPDDGMPRLSLKDAAPFIP